MPLDAVCIKALSEELQARVAGMKVDKVQQPERDVIILSLRAPGESLRLLLCAGSGSARIHLTEASYEQPPSPPMFCMLLRKHLQGARISAFEQPENERLLLIEFNAFDDMGYASVKRLALEMIGLSPNLILIGADGLIIDCLRRVDISASERRQVLPGLIYRLPPVQEKPAFFSCEPETRRALWGQAQPALTADKWLIDTFGALSPLICRELCCRAFGDASPRVGALNDEERDSFPAAMDALADMVKAKEFTPTLLVDGDKPKDFSFMPIKQYGGALDCLEFADFSSLLEAFYTRRGQLERAAKRAQSLTKAVKTARDRAARKLALRRGELEKTAGRDTQRKLGDLITANLYRMEKGQKEVTVQDYFDENCPEIIIPLDPLKTPQQNAARYYKNYNKAKSAEKYLSGLIESGEKELAYLESVLAELALVQTDRDLMAIRAELELSGYVKKQSGSKREKAQAPLSFMTGAGLEILVGRSNAQNDELTFKTARRTDIWLHAQKIHGAHVILRCSDAEPDIASLEQAASLAAYHSQARGGGKIPVDYTMVKYVKKPSGALPGMVVYTNQKTIMADGQLTVDNDNRRER